MFNHTNAKVIECKNKAEDGKIGPRGNDGWGGLNLCRYSWSKNGTHYWIKDQIVDANGKKHNDGNFYEMNTEFFTQFSSLDAKSSSFNLTIKVHMGRKYFDSAGTITADKDNNYYIWTFAGTRAAATDIVHFVGDEKLKRYNDSSVSFYYLAKGKYGYGLNSASRYDFENFEIVTWAAPTADDGEFLSAQCYNNNGTKV